MKKMSVRWLTVITIGLLVIAAVFFAVGLAHDWGAGQYGAFSAWLFGLATLAGVGVALVSADHARTEADKARESAAEDQRRIEHRRRVDFEVTRRLNGMELCREIIDRLIEAQISLANAAKDAAFAEGEPLVQANYGLVVNLLWRRLRPEIGVRVIPINRTAFAREVKDTLERVDPLFVGLEFGGKSVSELMVYVDRIEDVMLGVSERLVAAAEESFALDLDAISAVVDEQWAEGESKPSEPDDSGDVDDHVEDVVGEDEQPER